GVIRGQLQKAEQTVLMAITDSRNVIPAITDLNAFGTQTFIIGTTRDRTGTLTSAFVESAFSYNFPERVLFTGYPINGGPAGANGPAVVTFFADPEGDPSSASGVGTQLPIAVGID